MMDHFKVLIVDDERDFLETVVRRLGKRAIEAVGVESGEHAVDLLKKRHFDVVLLDVKLPGGMDGIETLREIKKIQPMAEVILLTGHGSVETSIEGMKLGAFDYLLKPVRLEGLLEKMSQALHRKGEQEQKIRSAKIRDLMQAGEGTP